MAKEMSVTVEGKGKDRELVIRLPLQEPKPSGSGKTLVVATTHGNVTTDVEIDHKPVKVGVNAFIAKD